MLGVAQDDNPMLISKHCRQPTARPGIAASAKTSSQSDQTQEREKELKFAQIYQDLQNVFSALLTLVIWACVNNEQ